MKLIVGVLTAGEQRIHAFSGCGRSYWKPVWRDQKKKGASKTQRLGKVQCVERVWMVQGGAKDNTRIEEIEARQSALLFGHFRSQRPVWQWRSPSFNSVLWSSVRRVTGTIFGSSSVFLVPYLRPCSICVKEERWCFCRNARNEACSISGERAEQKCSFGCASVLSAEGVNGVGECWSVVIIAGDKRIICPAVRRICSGGTKGETNCSSAEELL